ncbi:AN1-type Zinc finger protein [Halovivax asiaticus JCM 14624]|uniref:AN1-type Zinc finger protein n=1 Tax=Halovivax asiaticus JCM 14624 TaxID=1227490 RepID=M0BME5_9EURY|nr:metalloprotease family protein [Halovivax asiaticus]ELZ11657.1 AN1-type Zinc finger protein [Halovivax asiaticus JCM 14624]
MGSLGFLLTLVTFPGVIVHELAHKRVCDLFGIPVLEVCYFRIGNPAGYVRHAEPRRYRHATMITVAPFLLNTVLALVAFGGVVLSTSAGGAVTDVGIVGGVLCWLGLSFGMHAFPSAGDASALWGQTKSKWRTSPTVLLGLPVIALIHVVNLLRALWLDLVYAVALFVLVTSTVTSVPV